MILNLIAQMNMQVKHYVQFMLKSCKLLQFNSLFQFSNLLCIVLQLVFNPFVILFMSSVVEKGEVVNHHNYCSCRNKHRCLRNEKEEIFPSSRTPIFYQIPHNSSVIVEIISRSEGSTCIRGLHFSKNVA